MDIFRLSTAANASPRRRPTIIRPVRGRLHVWLPFKASGIHNREWIKTGFGTGRNLRPELVSPENVWRVSRAHLEACVEAIADTCGAVDVFLQFSEAQGCDERCMKARGDECICSCLGTNHGGGIYGSGVLPRIGSVPVGNGVTEVHTSVRRGEGWKFAA